jgi:hypothetical protein
MAVSMTLFTMMVMMTLSVAMPSPVSLNRCRGTFGDLYPQDPAYFLEIV